jgi:GNAT superfamily N-acetyltransferase
MAMIIRPATASDLDPMTWVLIGASPADPVYPYRFPDRHLYPQEFADLCRQKCTEYLATSSVVVCEMQSNADPEKMKVVAFGAWERCKPKVNANFNLSFRRSRQKDCCNLSSQVSHGRFHQQQPPIVPKIVPAAPTPAQAGTTSKIPVFGNQDRMNAFRDECAAAKTSFFDSRYRKRGHMFLKILLCHPDYQRRGAGRALTEWGINEARRLGLNTTVFASPMGYRLYRKLGFRQIGRFRVQLDGEEAFLEIPALLLRPDVDAQRSSQQQLE